TDCGGKTCSEAQVCKDGKCVCVIGQCRKYCPNGFKKDENGCTFPCTCA
uniref:Piguamerin n=1 Tax=Hirudo nipponia TaxID=42736 RepID=PIGU_HIRNI|nr:RecName: Full=Piguamerin [Hirudo nipponia]